MQKALLTALKLLIGVSVRVYIVIGLSALAMIFLVHSIQSSIYDNLEKQRAMELRHLVALAQDIARNAHSEWQAGNLSLEEAQTQAKNTLRDLRYSGDGYFYVYDPTGTVVVLGPKPELEGKSLIDLQDENGFYVIRSVLDAAQGVGDGLSHYLWPKPGSDVSQPKMSFTGSFPEWEWAIGTGVYVDDLQDQAAAIKEQLNRFLYGALAVLFVVSTIMARSITKPLRFMRTRLAALSAGNYETSPKYTIWVDEVGDMARDVNALSDALREKDQTAAEAELARARAASAELEAQKKAAQQEKKKKEDDLRRERELHEAEAKAAEEKALQAARERQQNEETAAEQKRVVDVMADALRKLSMGDLSYEIDAAMPPDYERLRDDFNAAVHALRDAIGSVSGNANIIMSETSELSAAADDLSKRTEHQAATLEQAAAAISEITATVKSSKSTAKEAFDMSRRAQEKTENGGDIVRKAVTSMTELQASSDNISTITNVIDEIAFQTNLLALNAGVEAARAGDAGRGFAVVATEVRALAQRSSEAAREIGDLIATSSSQVEQGVDLVKKTGEAFADIETSIAGISTHAENIASSAEQQSLTLEEINVAVESLDNVTQQNVTMFEESTAASQNLKIRAEELTAATGKFQMIGQAVAPSEVAEDTGFAA